MSDSYERRKLFFSFLLQVKIFKGIIHHIKIIFLLEKKGINKIYVNGGAEMLIPNDNVLIIKETYSLRSLIEYITAIILLLLIYEIITVVVIQSRLILLKRLLKQKGKNMEEQKEQECEEMQTTTKFAKTQIKSESNVEDDMLKENAEFVATAMKLNNRRRW